jgi:hypothetical protein
MTERRPGVTVRAKTGKAYFAKSRNVHITEFRVSFDEWGKLQGIILREAARGFGVHKGEIVLRLARPESSQATFTDGSLSVVRRGARGAATRG